MTYLRSLNISVRKYNNCIVNKMHSERETAMEIVKSYTLPCRIQAILNIKIEQREESLPLQISIFKAGIILRLLLANFCYISTLSFGKTKCQIYALKNTKPSFQYNI